MRKQTATTTDGALRQRAESHLRELPVGESPVASKADMQRMELHSHFAAFLKHVFSGETTHSNDFELVRPGCPPVIMHVEAQRLPGGQECRAVVVDITARKQAEEQVRVSEIRYRRLFEAAQDGVLILDPATCKITDANPFMTQLLGYPQGQLVGKELFEIGLLKDETASQEMFRKLKKTHQVRYENLPLENRSGRHQEVEVVANLYEENGLPVIQCNIRDITKRKQMEDAVRRNEALLTALIEEAPLGVYLVDAHFCLQQVNPKALPEFRKVTPLIGCDFSEVVEQLWPKRLAAQVLARFRHTLATGEPYKAPDFTGRRRDIGVTEFYEWQIKRITLPSGEHGVVCFFDNITERKRAEENQRRLDVLTATNGKLKKEIVHRQVVEAALTKSEQRAQNLLKKSRELQKQVQNVSHQILMAEENLRREISHELHDKISQLLLGINVHLGIFAKAAVKDPQGIRRTITPLRRMVEKSVQTVHDFSAELRPSMLDDLGLVAALRSYVSQFPKRRGRSIEFVACDGCELLNNDKRTMLYRVAQEALVNVVKHARASVVKVTISKVRGGICLEVKDDGKAFEVSRLGSGEWHNRLGVTGMRERVEMIGGHFRVDSAVGQGTTIRAVVPIAKR